jgi:quercetin dioxygenase-like cupin family protein
MSETERIPPKQNLADIQPRFGDWGPGYLVPEGDAAFGAVYLRPGDEFGNHYHERHEESFLVLEGRAELWLDRSQLVELAPGDLIRCRPGVEHFLRNTSDEPFRAFFIKAPGVPGDKVDAEWRPAD